MNLLLLAAASDSSAARKSDRHQNDTEQPANSTCTGSSFSAAGKHSALFSRGVVTPSGSTAMNAAAAMVMDRCACCGSPGLAISSSVSVAAASSVAPM